MTVDAWWAVVPIGVLLVAALVDQWRKRHSKGVDVPRRGVWPGR